MTRAGLCRRETNAAGAPARREDAGASGSRRPSAVSRTISTAGKTNIARLASPRCLPLQGPDAGLLKSPTWLQRLGAGDMCEAYGG